MPANTAFLGPGGGGGNNPLGLIGPTAFGQISGSTDSALLPAFTFGSDQSLGFYRSAASTVALSYGTLSLPATLSVASIAVSGNLVVTGTSGISIGGVISVNTLSMQTYNAASGMTKGQVILIFNASGLSLAYSSGASMYFFGGSTVSAVQS